MSKAHEEDLVCISQIIMILPRIKNTFCVRVFGFWKTYPKVLQSSTGASRFPFLVLFGNKVMQKYNFRGETARCNALFFVSVSLQSLSIKHDDRSFLQKEERLNKTSVFWKRPNKRVKIFFFNASSHFFFVNVWNISWRRQFLLYARSIRKSFFPPVKSVCQARGSQVPVYWKARRCPSRRV